MKKILFIFLFLITIQANAQSNSTAKLSDLIQNDFTVVDLLEQISKKKLFPYYNPYLNIDKEIYLENIEIDTIPVSWVKENDLYTLMGYIYSKDSCYAFKHMNSQPTISKDAQLGGYAALFVNMYRTGEPINFGFYLSPKVDRKLNAELELWWEEEEKRIFKKLKKEQENYGFSGDDYLSKNRNLRQLLSFWIMFEFLKPVK